MPGRFFDQFIIGEVLTHDLRRTETENGDLVCQCKRSALLRGR